MYRSIILKTCELRPQQPTGTRLLDRARELPSSRPSNLPTNKKILRAPMVLCEYVAMLSLTLRGNQLDAVNGFDFCAA